MSNPSKVTEIATIDVCMVVMQTLSAAYALDTASKIDVEPQIETQDAVKLIVKGVLKAQKREVSTITGTKITLTDNVFAPEEVKILQGGTIQNATKYTFTCPSVGQATGSYYIKAGDDYISFTLASALEEDDTIVYTDTGTLVVTKGGLSSSLAYTSGTTVPGTGSQLTVTSATDTATIKSYTPPAVGSGTKGEIFSLVVYSAQYNAAGDIVQYEKITYPNCQGVPVAFSSEDGVFRTPEYTINSAPNSDQPPYYLEYVASLPQLAS